MLSVLRKYALQIAVLLFVLLLVAVIYDMFFSPDAKLIRYLEAQVEAKEAEIADLREEYENLTKEQQERLREIAELKKTLSDIREQLAAGSIDIQQIKTEIMSVEDAIEIIEQHTRGSVDRSRGVLAVGDERPD